MVKKYKHDKCPICKSQKRIKFKYEIICPDCGCVLIGTLPAYVNGRKIRYL